MKKLLIALIVIVAIIGIYLYATPAGAPETPAPNSTQTTEPILFTWVFEKSDTLNLDGQPKTNVALHITYSDDSVDALTVDTVDGGCSLYPDLDTDSVPISKSAQCYYAGFGQHYKITEGENAYRVQRTYIEEGLPDQPAPEYKFETIKEIAFTK